jgi:hypothetical protein
MKFVIVMNGVTKKAFLWPLKQQKLTIIFGKCCPTQMEIMLVPPLLPILLTTFGINNAINNRVKAYAEGILYPLSLMLVNTCCWASQ